MPAAGKLALALLLATSSFAKDARIARVEQGLLPPRVIEGGPVWTIEARMERYEIPGLSVAVVDGGRLAWVKGYGVADVSTGRKVTPRTMFLAGSISKPVTAIAAVDLVEKGRLPFDAGVNTLLRSWQLPSNELTAKTPVTLRQLFSHTAGTTVHGFPGYPRAFERPTIQQILDGEPPANTAPVRVDLEPDTQHRYSGGGTTVAQLAMSDVTGLDFPELMRRHVLGPLGMASSTYEQPLPRALHGRAASGHHAGPRPIPGGWHVYPEAAAAGLWTTPGDLAKVIVEMHDALAGRRPRVLSIDGARMMLTPRFRAGEDSWIGIGFFLEDQGAERYFAHGGSDEGFEALLIATEDGSQGAVLMANANGTMPLIDEVLRAIAREYQWPGFLDIAPPVLPMPIDVLAGAPGRYRVDAERVIAIQRSGPALETLTLGQLVQLYPLADGTLARSDADERYRLTGAGLEVITEDKTIVAPRTEDPLTTYELLAGCRVDQVVANFRAKPDERAVNRAGYSLLRVGRRSDAVVLFELNTELHAQSANAWDSLGDALYAKGELPRAAEATRRAQSLLDADTSLDERAKQGAAVGYPGATPRH